MILTQNIVLFLSFICVAVSAPVTLFQTTTATTPAATAAATAQATNTAAASAAGQSSESPWKGLFTSLSSWLEGFEGDSLSSNKLSSSSGLFSWSKLLDRLFGNSGSGSGTSGPSGPTSTGVATTSSVQASTPVTSAATSTSSDFLNGWLGGSGTSTTSTSSNDDSATLTSSGSTSSNTGGIYDAIYNSKEDIDKSFAKDILDAHNKYRSQHGVADLAWAEGPYEYAKKNADDYDCSGVLTHTHGQYGENLAAGFANGPAAVKAWYDEGDTFNYNTYNEYNHFTQVVWKGSQRVGCAYKDCRAENWGLYVVCEYDPPGNVIGWEQNNVLKPVN